MGRVVNFEKGEFGSKLIAVDAPTTTSGAVSPMAREISIQPEVILMDEPASALDPIATLKIEELMQELKKNYTIVIVTHNMQQAARASDYTAMMMLADRQARSGTVIEFDETNRIFTNPKDKRTEDYVTGRFG